MRRSQEDLFMAMSIGIMFRLGFQSLLTSAARQQGPHAMPWLAEFESRVIADARKMKAPRDVSETLVHATVNAVVSEFKQVFHAVRLQIRSEGLSRWDRRRPNAMPRRQISSSAAHERFRRI